MASYDPDCVQVAVRIRPLVKSEIENGCQSVVEKINNEPQVVIKKNGSFTFNYVFDSYDNQKIIYETAVHENLKKLFMGYNVTILAYGQTGSGKTHTMGTVYDGILSDDVGIIPRAIEDIFHEVQSISSEYLCQISCSFIELYQEQLYDLLSKQPRGQSIVDIREDCHKEIVIPKLTEIKVNNMKQIIDCLIKGSNGRAVGATAMNEKSSRSHAIFTINIKKTKVDDINDYTTSKFHLVDLAGSERPKKTKAVGDRFKEGVKINQGLFALGNVISALGGNQVSYIGYRESKLTRLLQDSLGGNSVTLMIACVSPADYNLEETLSTLRYADRAKKIKNKPIINQDPRIAEIRHLNSVIEKLKLELESRSVPIEDDKNEINGSNDDNKNDTTEEINRLQNKIDVLTEKNRNLQKQLQMTLDDVTEHELKATSAETINEQLQQKLNEIKEISNFSLTSNLINENQCKDHYEQFKKILDICNNANEVIEDDKAELDNQQKTFIIEKQTEEKEEEELEEKEVLETSEMQEKICEINTKRLHINDELRTLNNELNEKERLRKEISSNLESLCTYDADSSLKLKTFEMNIKKLEAERNDLLNKLKNNKINNVSAKLSEERRKRLQQLELEITELKKKNLQQAKMLKVREKESQKIIALNKEIQEMKATKVKLVREMRIESEKFKQLKFTKEKEIVQLKEKDRKREVELVRIKLLHDKQKNVYQRKLQETALINKRLKDTIEKNKLIQNQRKLSNWGKIEQILTSVDQELEIIISVAGAQYSLEHLMVLRATLTNQLNLYKESNDDDKETATNSIQSQIDSCNEQISSLQQQIIDINVEDKINSLTENIQNIICARMALKHLFSTITEMKRELCTLKTKYNDLYDKNEMNHKRKLELEKNITDLLIKHNEEKYEIERNYEEKITILLRELNKTQHIVLNDNDITPEIYQRIQIQEQTIDKYEKILQECENYKRMYEELLQSNNNTNKENNKTLLKPPQNKRLTKLKEQMVEIIESDYTEDEEDDTSNDPDWVKSPMHRYPRHTHTFKRASDGTTRCKCKQPCSTKLCSCKKNGVNCTTSCKCPGTCMNNKLISTIKEELSLGESSTDHTENTSAKSHNESDNKENFSDHNINSISDDHTPKKIKIEPTDDVFVPTPSYPYSKKKRTPYYKN